MLNVKEKETRNAVHPIQDRPLGGACFEGGGNNRIVVDVVLEWPIGDGVGVPYTPPPEDYEKVVEASLGTSIAKLGIVARNEIERIYYDGLCGGARGHTRKMIPFKNWVAYVVKCLWQSHKQGLLHGCRQPMSVHTK